MKLTTFAILTLLMLSTNTISGVVHVDASPKRVQGVDVFQFSGVFKSIEHADFLYNLWRIEAVSRKTSDLHPIVRDKAERLIVLCMNAGLPVLITDTLRTREEQARLYAQGRTRPGRIVTWAEAGESYHNYGLAFDVVLLREGKPFWYVEADIDKDGINDWEEIGRIGESIGLEWGGRWKKKDRPHFQCTFDLTIDDLLRGKTPPTWEVA